MEIKIHVHFHLNPYLKMELRSYCKWMVFIGVLFIWVIKFCIRPYIHLGPSLKFIAGIAPNLLGAFLVPFAAYWLYTHSQFFNRRLMRFDFFSDTRIVCLFGFSLAIINEYLQLIPVFGRTFDYFDILFSAFGLISSYYTFAAMQRKLLMNYDQQ